MVGFAAVPVNGRSGRSGRLVAGLLLVAVPLQRLAWVATEGAGKAAEPLQRRREMKLARHATNREGLRESLVQQQVAEQMKMKEAFMQANKGVQEAEYPKRDAQLGTVLTTLKEACADSGVESTLTLDELMEALRVYRATKAVEEPDAADGCVLDADLTECLTEITASGWKAEELVLDPAALAQKEMAKQARLDRLQATKAQAAVAQTQRMEAIFNEAVKHLGDPYQASAPVPVAAAPAPAAAPVPAPVAAAAANNPVLNRIQTLLANPSLPPAARQALQSQLDELVADAA